MDPRCGFSAPYPALFWTVGLLWFLEDVVEEAGLSILQGCGAGSFAQDVHAEAGTPGVLGAEC